MKNIKELQAEQKVILEARGDYINKYQYSAAARRLLFLNTCLAYLKSEPDKDFLIRQAARIERRIELIYKDYPNFDTIKTFDTDDARFKFYLKECRIPQLKEQLKTIQYLLT